MARGKALAGRRRLAAVVAAAWVCYVSVVTTVLWLLGRGVGSALATAAGGGVTWLVVMLVLARLTGLRNRIAAGSGDVDVLVRSPDGHPRLSQGWRRAEVAPAAGQMRFFPLAGRSVAPFTVATHGLEEVEEDPRRWRDLLSGLDGDLRFLRVADGERTIEIAVQPERLPGLLDAVRSPRGPQA